MDERVEEDIGQTPLVSIILLCYKNLTFLYESIDSILIQNYNPIEFILADDGTPDFPIEDVKKYVKDKAADNICDVNIYSNEKNMMTVKNFTEAIKRAQGKYIFGIGCGDKYLNAKTIGKIVSYMEKNELDMVLAKRIVCDENYNELAIYPNSEAEEKIKKLDTPLKQYRQFMIDHLYGVGSGASFIARKKVYEENHFHDQSYCLLEDAPLFAKLLRNGNLFHFYFSEPYVYHMSGGISTGDFSTVRIGKIYFDDCVRYYTVEESYIRKYLNFWQKMHFYYYKDYVLSSQYSRLKHLFFLPIILDEKYKKWKNKRINKRNIQKGGK